MITDIGLCVDNIDELEHELAQAAGVNDEGITFRLSNKTLMNIWCMLGVVLMLLISMASYYCGCSLFPLCRFCRRPTNVGTKLVELHKILPSTPISLWKKQNIGVSEDMSDETEDDETEFEWTETSETDETLSDLD